MKKCDRVIEVVFVLAITFLTAYQAVIAPMWNAHQKAAEQARRDREKFRQQMIEMINNDPALQRAREPSRSAK